MMGLGWQELTIILLIVVVIFGVGKLPELGSGLGRGVRDFKAQASDEGAGAIPSGTRQGLNSARTQSSTTSELRPDQI